MWILKINQKNYQSIKGKGIKFSYQDKIYNLGNERILKTFNEYQMAYQFLWDIRHYY